VTPSQAGPSARPPSGVPGMAAALPPGAAGGLPSALTIDALGKKCPIPIIMLAERIREVGIGQIVEVLADDPAAKTDLPAWCQIKSHRFITMTELPVGWSFLVKRCY